MIGKVLVTCLPPYILGTHSRVYFEDQAQGDGDIEAMTSRTLNKAKFQKLGIGDLNTVQETMLPGKH